MNIIFRILSQNRTSVQLVTKKAPFAFCLNSNCPTSILKLSDVEQNLTEFLDKSDPGTISILFNITPFYKSTHIMIFQIKYEELRHFISFFLFAKIHLYN